MHDEEAQKEHQWLQKLVGDWTYESEASMGPDKPLMKTSGTESVRTLGGVWFLAEGLMSMPDGTQGKTLMTLGYDPRKKRYLGTWIGAMMSHLWIYDGSLNAEGTVLALDSDGPSMAGDGTDARYRDSIEFKSDDHRILTSSVLDQSGNWNVFMTAHYHRTK